MIPKGSQNYAPWLPLEVGMKVKIMNEAQAKDNPKLKSPMYCDVDYKGSTYCVGLSWAAYRNISMNSSFGVDTTNWKGQYIQYLGKKPVKAKTGTVFAHMWQGITEEIDLLEKGQEIPF